ncbi:hypothetical protein BX285_7110 [Streptomyces sp. 1114.5]|uniref:hypothetical protein n=1 Tax=unclassified Streptomyces TaxID=2593676 RepID=UPI000BD5DAF8|nr:MULTISPECIES: hypothetical protein [unclassified Streptomyces]RKT08744.1 hypothetical protein BX285_7110 [Streptomyces sp. 1114.5]SOB78971.1 hypothetical protein SAMN06272789_0188 [Streptomyces sp. 1331.2]
MARVTVEGADLVVRLRWWERLVTRSGPLRVPLTAVEKVTTTRQPWRVVRGVRESGLLIPGRLCLGVWRHPGGRDFVALHPFTDVVVSIDLRRPSPFARIAVHATEAPRTVADLHTAVSRTVLAAGGLDEDVPGAVPEPENPPARPGGRWAGVPAHA